MNKSKLHIQKIENRFKEVADLQHLNLEKFPIRKADYDDQQQKTSKEACKERGYVTTPIFIVDIMVSMKQKELSPELNSCDLCAGECGQFTIRLMRFLYNKYKMNIKKWLEEKHTFVELDLEAVASLIYIYGRRINLLCGDATKLDYVPDNAHGILFQHGDKWEHNETIDKALKAKKVRNNLDVLKKLLCKFEKRDAKNEVSSEKNK